MYHVDNDIEMKAIVVHQLLNKFNTVIISMYV